MGTRCDGCKAGWTDEDGTGCACPVFGCREFSEDAQSILDAYFRTPSDDPEDLIFDSADFHAFTGGGDVDPDQWADAEEMLAMELLKSSREYCDHCDGQGRVEDDDEDRLATCPECEGRKFEVPLVPRLHIDCGGLVCCQCFALVREHDAGCRGCGGSFPVTTALAGSIAAHNDGPPVSQKRAVH